MSRYNNVLVAIDLGEYSGDLIDRAKSLAVDDSSVHVAYVQERLDSVYVGASPIGSALGQVHTIESDLNKELRSRLEGWGESHGIAGEQLHYLSGKPARALQEFAEDHAIDLIIIGTHSRKGLQRLLGSTANSVVHNATCDVLTVRAS